MKINNQHTPGPWHIEACIWPGYPFRISGPGEVAGTDGMFSPALVMGDGSHNAGTALANAALIAAAPELLEACKLIEAAHQQLFCGLPLCIDGKPIDHTALNSAFEAAQSAIAKAEGRP